MEEQRKKLLYTKALSRHVSDEERIEALRELLRMGEHAKREFWDTLSETAFYFSSPESVGKLVPIFMESLRKGQHLNPHLWGVLEDIVYYLPDTAKHFIPVFIEGARMGAHEEPSFWSALEQIVKHKDRIPEEVKHLLTELYNFGVRDYGQYWRLVEDVIEHPEIGKHLIKALFERSATSHPSYWEILYAASAHRYAKDVHPDHPATAFLKFFRALAWDEAHPEKALEILEKHKDHPLIRPVYKLIKISPHSAFRLGTKPFDLYQFLRYAQKIEHTEENLLELYRILHLIKRVELEEGLDSGEFFSPDLRVFRERLLRILKQ